jgi:hypothetical protein
MALQCCGEHLFTAEEVRLHDETYHRQDEDRCECASCVDPFPHWED